MSSKFSFLFCGANPEKKSEKSGRGKEKNEINSGVDK